MTLKSKTDILFLEGVDSMAKFCKNCGTEIPEGAKFCENCGQPVEQAQETQTAPASQPDQGVFSSAVGVNEGNNIKDGNQGE